MTTQDEESAAEFAARWEAAKQRALDGHLVLTLRRRAESYASDAGVLRAEGDKDAALIYETVASELRKISTDLGLT